MHTPIAALARPPGWRLIAAVVAVHALLLWPKPPIVQPGAPAPRPATLTLRALPPPMPATLPTAPVHAPAPPQPHKATPPRSPLTPARVRRTPAPAPKVRVPAPLRPVAAASSQALRQKTAAAQRDAQHIEAPTNAALPNPLSGADHAPVRLPPSATLRYRVTATGRGAETEGESELVWALGALHYRASWSLDLPTSRAHGQRHQLSEGGVTPRGLVPQRYSVTARGERAAHFDAAGARIRFSANTPDAAWRADGQDRLSALLQLSALLAAAPERYPPGTLITLQTAGAREAEDWHWRVEGDELLTVAGRELPSAKLVREPAKPYEPRIELWLARPLGLLPVRMRTTAANGDMLEHNLQSLTE